jgi:hypothetical protein
MRRLVIVAAAVVGVAMVLAGGCLSVGTMSGWKTYEETRQASLPSVAGKPVRVSAINGYVHVDRRDVPDVQVTAKLCSSSQERLAAAKLVVARLPDGALDVHVDWPTGKRANNEGCSFDVAVPDARDVTVRTSNGSVRLTALAGRATVDTSNAMVNVIDHDGPVRVQTSNGAIEVQRVNGEVSAATSNASVKIVDVHGRVGASSSNGSVYLRLPGLTPAPFDLDTSNASVTVELPKSFAGRVGLGMSNARVHVNQMSNLTTCSLNGSSGTATFGAAATQTSRVSTSNGSIELQPSGQ